MGFGINGLILLTLDFVVCWELCPEMVLRLFCVELLLWLCERGFQEDVICSQ